MFTMNIDSNQQKTMNINTILRILMLPRMTIYAEKKMQYAHFDEIYDKSGNKRHKSHVHIKLTSVM